MFNRRSKLDKLSIEELEQALRIKQREARKARFLKLSAAGASRNAALLQQDTPAPTISRAATSPAAGAGLLQTPQRYALNRRVAAASGPQPRSWRDKLLVLVEAGAVLGLISVLVISYLNLQQLNQEAEDLQAAGPRVVLALQSKPGTDTQAAAAPTPNPGSFRLPGGHSSPTSAGGAVPDIPAHLQNWVQPAPAIPVPKPEVQVQAATRIVIPKINVDAPIIAGVTWEDLKKGVGHLPGSAQPGQRGNLYLAAHNDIFGEIFRYLEKLDPGDEYYIYAGETKFTYVVREKRIINPTDVEVMLPTTEPVATLQSCYPYLIDTHRIVIIGDLVE